MLKINNYIISIYRFFKRILRNQIQIKETLFFLEIDEYRKKNRFRYKHLISQKHTSWYENFERANYIMQIAQPNVVVDLGVDHGFSTFAFAFANKGKIFGIDSFEGDPHAGVRNTYDEVIDLHNSLMKEFEIADVQFIKGYFEDVAKTWNNSIDVLHIDGFHSYQAVKNDFETWEQFFNPNTIVLFHDIVSFKQTVGKYFNELEGFKYKFEDGCGLGVWSTNEKLIRQIGYFYN